MKTPATLGRYRVEIDAEIRAALEARRSPLYDMLRYHLGWVDEKGNVLACDAGKGLRPTLCLLACTAVAGDFHKALPASAALELVHNYSLIHDDIQDDDRERRHRPTVWSIWGKPQAINAGTAMRILANMALLRLETNGVPMAKQLRVQQLIDEDCLSLIEGQYLDISFETRNDIAVADYLDMIGKKTGALISGSLEIGALLGTDDARIIEAFRGIGMDLGLAFQIQDDILGIWGDEQQTGKPSCSDIRRKKKSFPVVYALESLRGIPRADLVGFYSNGQLSAESTARILGILDNADARTSAQHTARSYRDRAVAALDALPLNAPVKEDMRELFNFLVERSF